jgi:16S rRNA (adenine1518-N6/adenine1519-N6)-dimethyltransferase
VSRKLKPLRHQRRHKDDRRRPRVDDRPGRLPITSDADPRRVLSKAGLRPKKSWGQNFLCDPSVNAAIAEAAQADADHLVVELGAGTGALTRALLERGGTVIAVERDRDLVPILRRELGSSPKLQILEADAARLDYQHLALRTGGPLIVAGNLPYQLSSRIMVSLADAKDHVSRAVIMVQEEVAARLCAEPNSRVYGLLTVLVQRAFNAEILKRVGPEAFVPRPKVRSAVVQLTPHGLGFAPARDRHLVHAARAAFSARRKTLKNSLSGALKHGPLAIETALIAAGIEPMARAETLSVADFARLGDALAARDMLSAPLPVDPT